MYAVIVTGNKQYIVKKGDKIEAELLFLEPGKEINLDKVLLVADGDNVEIGKPYLKNAKVIAKVIEDFKGEKLITFKFKHKTRYHKKTGHRQKLTRLSIEDIKLS